MNGNLSWREPKRILALDGGGIRGVFTLQILAKIEALFRARQKNEKLVLADVYDLIAGTSTGAIIAAFLSWGWTVGEIERLYTARSREMFVPAPWYLRWKTKYRSDAIAGFFRAMFREEDGSEATLNSKRLRTQLLVVMRNASTGSPWPLTNNPQAKYSCDPSDPGCNLDIPLWKLLRASTAAPYYFAPQEIIFDLKRSRDALTFSTEDFKSTRAFVRRLKQPLDPMSVFLVSQLPAATRQAVMSHSASSAVPPSLQAAVVKSLNAIIKGPSIYEAKRFTQVALRPVTKRLLALAPQGEDLVRLNWLLLEDACPGEISRKQKPYLFVDGGVTPYNNPSLIAVLTATLPAYRMGWPAAREKLHVTSVGTGSVPGRLPPKVANRIHALDQLKEFPPAMLESVAVEQDMLCRILGDCLYGPAIDSEIGSLDTPALRGQLECKFTYVRYDEPFLVTGAKAKRLAQAKLDDLKLIPFLQAAGQKYASENVRFEHLYPRQAVSELGFVPHSESRRSAR